jgi:hypothetical protein
MLLQHNDNCSHFCYSHMLYMSEPVRIFLWVILTKHLVIIHDYFNVAFPIANHEVSANLIVFKFQIFA